MSVTPPQIEPDKSVRVRRGRVESVDLYEIKDSELESLERGSPADLQLNFGIFALSTAFSAACALTAATFPNETVHTVFVVVAVVGVMLGGYLLLQWRRSHSSQKELCARIRGRIPPEAMAVSPEDSPRGLPPGDPTCSN